LVAKILIAYEILPTLLTFSSEILPIFLATLGQGFPNQNFDEPMVTNILIGQTMA
jgi:hypothetical protein